MKQGFWNKESVQQRFGILLSLLVLGAYYSLNTAVATEVYTWTDKDGVTHFTDSPPESGDSQVMQIEDAYLPGTSGAYPVEGPTEAGSSEAEDNPGEENPQSRAEQMREQMALNREERKEKQAETAVMCEKYKHFLERLEPARRVMYTNEQGEEVRMDDDERVGRIEESKDYIAKNCK